MSEGREDISGVLPETAGQIEPENTQIEDINVEEHEDISDVSVRELAERAFEEEKAKVLSSGGENEQIQKEQGAKPAASKGQKGEIAPEFQVQAPARLTEQGKAVFNKLPPELKAATARMFKDVERQANAHWKEMSAATQQSKAVVDAINPFLHKWGDKGLTPAAAIAGLAAAYDRLANPETAVNEYISIGKQLGVNFAALAQFVDGGGGNVQPQGAQLPDISKHPQFVTLQQKLDSVYSAYEQARSKQEAANVQTAVSEMETVRNEKDGFGKLRYPELFDDGFLEEVKPLVDGFVRTFPGIGFGLAARAAYYSAKGLSPFDAVAQARSDSVQQNGNSAQPSPSRFPGNNNQQLERATLAAVSVRGRTAPQSVATGGSDDEAPPEVIAGGIRKIAEWSLARERQRAGR